MLHEQRCRLRTENERKMENEKENEAGSSTAERAAALHPGLCACWTCPCVCGNRTIALVRHGLHSAALSLEEEAAGSAVGGHDRGRGAADLGCAR